MYKNSFPNHPEKYLKTALFSPSEYIQYLAKYRSVDFNLVPECAVILFQNSLYKKIKRERSPKKIGNVLEVIQIENQKLGVAHVPGIGAPAAVVILEEMIALGVQRFIIIGTAGGLQQYQKIGDIVLCHQAIRDEGTSYHYLAPDKYAHSSPELSHKLFEQLKKNGQKVESGVSWTLDTPYRETVDEVRLYQSEGVLTVEMEAAALFAVAEYRKVAITAAFAISDSLAELKWNPQFFSPRVNTQLESIFSASVATLLNLNNY